MIPVLYLKNRRRCVCYEGIAVGKACNMPAILVFQTPDYETISITKTVDLFAKKSKGHSYLLSSIIVALDSDSLLSKAFNPYETTPNKKPGVNQPGLHRVPFS